MSTDWVRMKWLTRTVPALVAVGVLCAGCSKSPERVHAQPQHTTTTSTGWVIFDEPSGAFRARFPVKPDSDPLNVAGHSGKTWTAYDSAHSLTVGVGFLNAPSGEGFQSLTNKENSLRAAGVTPEVGIDPAGNAYVQYDQMLDGGTHVVGRWIVTEHRTYTLAAMGDPATATADALTADFESLLRSFEAH